MNYILDSNVIIHACAVQKKEGLKGAGQLIHPARHTNDARTDKRPLHSIRGHILGALYLLGV